VRRLASAAARAGLGVVLFLLVCALLRLGPVHAQPPWDVRALPLFAPVLLLALAAALTGGERRPGPVGALGAALGAGVVALVAVVAWRGPQGLAAQVSTGRGHAASLAPAAVDLVGDDLAALDHVRRRTITWEGPLRAPESGAYRLWVQGRGAVEVVVDGRRVLAGEGDPLEAGSALPLTQGAHALRVRLEQVGPGPRLRLGWTRPGGRSETIPPRDLGPPGPRVVSLLVDALSLVVAALVGLLAFVARWERPRRPPAPVPFTRQEAGLSLAGHAVLAALLSWPLVLDLAGSGPLRPPDGRLNAWILAWDVHALLHAPGRLFQAPIFHPLPDALAFTENLLLPAVLTAPAQVLGTPALAYNLALLGSAVLSGLGAQLLIRRASGDRMAAFVGGALFGVGAHRWFRTAHLHAEVTLFLPLALLALDRFWERPTLRRGLVLGLLVAAQGLSSVYLGAITATAVATAVAIGLAARPLGATLLRLGAGLALAAALLAPVAWPYLRMRAFQGMEFTLADQEIYATTLPSYAASPSRLYGPITERHMDPARTRDPLFPGLALLVLGVAGLAGAPPRYRAVALAASAVAVVISLGPQTAAYRFLHEHVVLFRGVRALSRFSLVPVLALCVLAGFALSGRSWRVSLVALVVLLAEAVQAPLHLAPYVPPSPASRWLASTEGAVADLPLGPEHDTQAMLDGLAHGRPLLNGDSGFVPRPYDREQELLEGPLGDDALRFLRAVDVRHLVSREDRPLPLAARFGEERIYAVPPGDAARAVEPGSAVPALWGAGPALVDLGKVQSVAAIAFELSDARWVERPRIEVSIDGRSWTAVAAEARLADAILSLIRDPRHGRGEVRLAGVPTRYLRLDPRLPARPGLLWVAP
jgi:hypothetical protein